MLPLAKALHGSRDTSRTADVNVARAKPSSPEADVCGMKLLRIASCEKTCRHMDGDDTSTNARIARRSSALLAYHHK